MTCREFEAELEAGLVDRARLASRIPFGAGDCELPNSIDSQALEHCEACAACKQHMRELLWLTASIQGLPLPIPPVSLASRVIASLKESPPATADLPSQLDRRPGFGRLHLRWTALAAALCVAVLLVDRARRSSPPDSSPALARSDETHGVGKQADAGQRPLAPSKRHFSPLGRGLFFAVQSRPAETRALASSSTNLLKTGLADIDLGKRLADKAEDWATATKSVGAGVRPVADSAGRAFAFLWNDASKLAPRDNRH